MRKPHGSPVDHSGRRFGRLYALRDVGSPSHCRGRLWYCLCSCGGRKIAISGTLAAGNTRSCGCLQLESARATGRANRNRRYATAKEIDKLHGELLGLDLDKALP